MGGCIDQVGAQGMNITRTAWLSHGGDRTTACSTVDSQCGSSQHAVNLAYSLIASGAEDTVLACGVESMSMVPLAANVMNGPGRPVSRSYFRHYEFTSQFEGAERIATAYSISRQDTDELGLESQLRAATAQREGRFETQIVPLDAVLVDSDGRKTGETVEFSRDEVPRDTSMEALAGLKPVARDDGNPHRGHVVADRRRRGRGAADVGRRGGRARLEAHGPGGPDRAGGLRPGADAEEGPIPATERVLAREGITIDDDRRVRGQRGPSPRW